MGVTTLGFGIRDLGFKVSRERILSFLDRLLLVVFYVTLVIVFLRPSWARFSTAFGHVSLTSARNLALVLCGIWLAGCIVSPRRYFTRSGMEYPLLLFLAAGVVSAALSPYGSAGDRWTAVGEAAFYGIFFLTGAYLVRTAVSGWTVARILVSAASVVAAMDLIYHYRMGIWKIIDQGFPFWDGKNALGLFMVMALCMGSALFLTREPISGGSGKGGSGACSCAMIPCMVLIFLCIVYSYSRGAWLALGAGVFTFALLRSWKWAVAFLAVAIIVVAFLPHKRVMKRAISTARLSDYNVTRRVAVWRDALLMVRSRPLAGVGPGVFRRACPQFEERQGMREPGREWKGKTRYREHAHNIFLQVAAETGIPGAVALVWGIVAVARAARGRLKDPRDEADLALTQGITAALVAFAIFSCLDCSWNGRFVGGSFMHINLTVALLLAILVAPGSTPHVPQGEH